MNKIIKKAINPLFQLLVDKGSYLSLEKNNNITKLIFNTFKYRLAGVGMFMTENEKKFAALKDVHKGKRCFIIGNGPSLNKMDLKKLKNEYTFGVNAIYLNKENMGFDPTYYVVEDYLVAEDRAEEINRYHGPKQKFFGSYLDYCLKKDDDTTVMNVLLNYSDTDYKPVFSKNPIRAIGVGGSVTFICLQLAYYFGFEEVYMIGFDHHYNVSKGTEIIDNVITSDKDDDNHFNPSYFGKGYRWHDPKVDRMELGFQCAKENFEADGRKVFNATVDGHLEVFDRVSYESLFAN